MALRNCVKNLYGICFISNSLIRKKYIMSGSLINVAVNEKTGVVIATLQRPPVNSLNLELLSELLNTISELEKNRCRGLILTSNSNNVFSAGLDLLELYKPDPNRFKKFWSALQQAWIKLYSASFSTVAVINGHAPAGGCLLSLSCDYRIMLNNFTIGLHETQVGIFVPLWISACMINVIGYRQAELALTGGTMFKTDEAVRIGLVDEMVVSKEEALEKAEAFLQRSAKIPPVPLAVTKKSLREQTVQSLTKNLQNDLDMFFTNLNREDVQKGIEIYLQSLKQKQKKQ